MSEILQAIVLGIVQGATEFIPVSSSGHLVLAREVFGMKDPGIAMDTVLHLGTLLAAVMFFVKDWIKIIRALLMKIVGKLDPKDNTYFNDGIYIILGTIPAVVAGLLFIDSLEGWFRDGKVVAGFMIAVGVWFLITEIAVSKRKDEINNKKIGNGGIGFLKSIYIGCFQALALIPGVSRSGMTISAGMLAGFSREKAARFSFLLSAPVILAAGILGIWDLLENGSGGVGLVSIVVGFVVAAVVGFIAIAWLMKYLKTKTLYIFALYLIIVGGILMLAI